MRGHIVKHALAVAVVAATPALAYDLDKPIQVNTSGLQSNVAAKVQKHADESLKSLMAYLWFTRRMHHLWIEDVTRPLPDAIATNDRPYQPRQMATRTTGRR